MFHSDVTTSADRPNKALQTKIVSKQEQLRVNWSLVFYILATSKNGSYDFLIVYAGVNKDICKSNMDIFQTWACFILFVYR